MSGVRGLSLDRDSGGSSGLTLRLDSGIAAGGPSSLDLVALDRALEALAAFDARKVQVVVTGPL